MGIGRRRARRQKREMRRDFADERRGGLPAGQTFGQALAPAGKAEQDGQTGAAQTQSRSQSSRGAPARRRAILSRSSLAPAGLCSKSKPLA